MSTIIPKGFCQCGCGRKTKIAPRNRKNLGWVKGEPLAYLLGHNRLFVRGPETPEGFKWCGTCETVKPVGDFADNKTQVDGLQGHCRQCGRDKQAHWRSNNRIYATRMATDSHRRTKLGIEPHEYDAMLDAQGGVCAICSQSCGVNPSGTPRALAVDHDHDTGAIRGLLCSRCNTAIGLLRDCPDILALASEYLALNKPIDQLLDLKKR